MDCEQIIELVVWLCLKFEGLRLKPYLCPAGIPTIGVGCTSYENGRAVRLSDPPITRERAMQLLRWRIRKEFMPAVMRLAHTLKTEEQFAAIIDFAFNLGVGRLKASTLLKRILAEQWDQVGPEVLKWDKAGGRTLRGLHARRLAENGLACW